MRKWLAIFLLMMIPLQFTWAATSAYCQHEKGVAIQHVGHHGHQHQKLSSERSVADQAKPSGLDLDCGTCHAGCSFVVTSVLSNSVLTTSTEIEANTERLRTSPPLKVPDRPKWISRS